MSPFDKICALSQQTRWEAVMALKKLESEGKPMVYLQELAIETGYRTSVLSHQLQTLLQAGFVTRSRAGHRVLYGLRREGFEELQLVFKNIATMEFTNGPAAAEDETA